MSNDWTIDPTLGAREGFVDVGGPPNLVRRRRRRGGRASRREGAAAAAPRRPRRLSRLPRVDGRALRDRATGDLLRPAGLRQLGPARRPGALDRRLLPARDRCRSAARSGLERCHILGQSWGGMLLMEYLVGRPAGLVSATIASSPASMPWWIAETGAQRAALPRETIATLERHEAAGTWDDPEYEAAVQVFYDRHLCRVVPMPRVRPALVRQAGPQPAGLPHDERPDRVPRRRHAEGLGDPVAAGRGGGADPADERPPRRGDPVQMAAIADRIPQAEWVLFEASGHLAHAEEPDRYMAAVGDFLARAETGHVRRRATPGPAPAAAGTRQRPAPPAPGRLTGRGAARRNREPAPNRSEPATDDGIARRCHGRRGRGRAAARGARPPGHLPAPGG